MIDMTPKLKKVCTFTCPERELKRVIAMVIKYHDDLRNREH